MLRVGDDLGVYLSQRPHGHVLRHAGDTGVFGGQWWDSDGDLGYGVRRPLIATSSYIRPKIHREAM